MRYGIRIESVIKRTNSFKFCLSCDIVAHLFYEMVELLCKELKAL